MKNNKELIIYGIILMLAVSVIASYFLFFTSPYKAGGDGPIKILMIHSYYSAYPSVVESIKGFEDYFKEKDVEIEVRQYYMGEERNYSDANLKKEAEKAMAQIDEWEPDIIYLTDDYAPQYVGMNYVNSKIPVVFSGVNEEISDYNFDKADNVAGVMEREKLERAIGELRNLVPDAKKVIVMSDSLKLWKTTMRRLKESQGEISDLEVLGWFTLYSFEEYKNLINEYKDKVDAFIILGINTLKDEEGNSIPRGEGMKWNALNNNETPSICFSSSCGRWGGLLETSTYNYQHGRFAGLTAYRILVEGELPKDVGFMKVERANRIINLARAKTLGIDIDEIPSEVLINSEVVETFPWETEDGQ